MFPVCAFNKEIQEAVMVFFCVCLSVFVCRYVFPVCAVKKEYKKPDGLCLCVFVYLCVFVCIYLSLFAFLYVFPVCAVEKEIQEAVMPSRHIGQLAVSLSSQTANARFSSSLLKKKIKIQFSSSLLKKKIKIQILFLPTREKINTKYKLFLLPPQYSLFPANSSRPKFSFKILTKFQP